MRQTVFVLGAGASKACGLPLTNELLPSIIPAIDKKSVRTQLLDFISYLYPHFEVDWKNYPNFEELLGQFEIYVRFSKKVKAKHKFALGEIADLKNEVLRTISIFLDESIPDSKIKSSPISTLAAMLELVSKFDSCLK